MPLKHVVEQGECINSIAFEAGFFPDTVWNHADNKDLKEKRKNMDVLLPGDIVTIPDKKIKELSKPPEKLHKFKRKGVPKELKLQIMLGTKAQANVRCVVTIGERASELKTDGDGWLKISIPPNAKEAKVRLESGQEFTLSLGSMDPVDQTSGVQGRLHALGYYSGPIDGQMNEETKEALKAFQKAHGLEQSGQPDDKTKKSLADAAAS
jgi:N-acetylmuramoyl-L-alanine amidase